MMRVSICSAAPCTAVIPSSPFARYMTYDDDVTAVTCRPVFVSLPSITQTNQQ